MTPHFKAVLVVSALVALALLAGCAAPAAEGVVIPPDVMAACKAEGGCTLISRARLEQVLQETAEKICRGSI